MGYLAGILDDHGAPNLGGGAHTSYPLYVWSHRYK